MSDTPRIDEQMFYAETGRWRDGVDVVKADFARELEVENQQMRTLLTKIAQVLDQEDNFSFSSRVESIQELFNERTSLFTNSSNINDSESSPPI